MMILLLVLTNKYSTKRCRAFELNCVVVILLQHNTVPGLIPCSAHSCFQNSIPTTKLNKNHIINKNIQKLKWPFSVPFWIINNSTVVHVRVKQSNFLKSFTSECISNFTLENHFKNSSRKLKKKFGLISSRLSMSITVSYFTYSGFRIVPAEGWWFHEACSWM